jgi:phage shock protein A
MTQTTIKPLDELEEALKERNTILRYIAQYRDEYKRIRMKVRDWKHQVKALNHKIKEMEAKDGHIPG